MNRERLEKIIRIAADVRANPNVRGVAESMIKKIRVSHPHLFAQQRTRHPGLQLDPKYERYIFADLEQWHTAKGGSRYKSLMRNGKAYKIVLSKRLSIDKRTHYAWTIHNVDDGTVDVSLEPYTTIDNARMGAWRRLGEL